MYLAPLLRRFRSVGWSGILLKCSLLSAKVATGPRNHHGVHDITAVNVLVNFYLLVDENQRGLPGGAQTMVDFGFGSAGDSRRSGCIGAPAPVFLIILGLINGV